LKEEEEEEEEERRRRRKVTVGRAGICRIWKHEVDTCQVILDISSPKIFITFEVKLDACNYIYSTLV